MIKNRILKIYMQYIPLYVVILSMDIFSVFVFFSLSSFLVKITSNFQNLKALIMDKDIFTIEFLPLFFYFLSVPIDSLKNYLAELFLLADPREKIQTLILKNIMTSQFDHFSLLEINRKINAFTSAVSNMRMPIINILKILFSLYAVFIVNYGIALICCAFLVIIFILGQKFLKNEKRGFLHLDTAASHCAELLEELSDGLLTIKNNSAEDFFMMRFKNTTDYLAKSFYLTGITGRLRETIFTFITFMLPVVFVCINLCMQNGDKIENLGGAYSVFLLLLPIIMSLINTNFIMYQGLNHFRLINQFTELKGVHYIKDKIHTIHIENVDFISLEGKPVLQNIHLKINSGEKIGIIGKTGSGKSTIVKILVNNLVPSKGMVKYNGKAIPAEAVLSSKIGLADMQGFIFSGTLRENILLGLVEYDEQFLKEALEVFSLKYAIDERIHKNLSGGEKARVSLLRALMRKPDFIIIDEALSSVSSKLAENIIAFVKKHTETIIIISHRFSDIKDMDRVIMVEDGQIIFDKALENAMQEETVQKLFNEQFVQAGN